MPYYGVYIPAKGNGSSSINNGANTANSSNFADSANDVHKDNQETDTSTFVFQEKREALQVLKQNKDARLKEFLNEEDALKFAQTGFEIVQNKYNDVKTSLDTLEKAPFKAPTKQQLVKFRGCIEHDDWKSVQKIIWENPRYLVSSGDTPTILKEGFRYNAMHVCAIHNTPNVAQLILDTVSDPKFADLIMGKKSDEKLCKELCANLLDYYLNIPEKGRNETPLHFAAKFGHTQIVAILTSYPQCKMLRNIQGLLPKAIICERSRNRNMYADVLKLFEERYYVPVLRSNDSAIPGEIGEPFSANDPPTKSCDPLSPEMEIKALAGPMSQEKAKKFFRRWKTPPRLDSNASSPIANNPFISPMKMRNSTPTKTPLGSTSIFNLSTANLRKRLLFNSTPQRHDQNNGVINSNGFDKSMFDALCDTNDQDVDNEVKEMVGELNLSNKNETNNNKNINDNHLDNVSKTQMNVLKPSLCPGTPLFKLKNNAFSIYRDQQNFASPVLSTFELTTQGNRDSLLNVSEVFDSPSYKERHVKNTDVEKGLECIGRVLATQENIEWREYWDFLEEFIDIASEKGLQKLEDYLAQRQKKQDERNNKIESSQQPDILNDVCNALENAFRISGTPTIPAKNTTTTTNALTTPYTYVEKSLQVHARRMTKTIIHNIDNEVSIVDALLLELRRVKSLIYSFKEDASYVNVNFQKVHSRIGNLVSMFLENTQEVSKQMKWKIILILQKISTEQGERREHMECVCGRIFQMLQHPTEQTPPESVKSEELCSKIWSEENDCDCQWESNLSRKASHRNRMEARYKNHQRLKQQEKLQKDLENQSKVINKAEEEEQSCSTKDQGKNDTSDDDEFWSDFGGSDSDENEIFLTPRESPSRLESSDDNDDDSNKIFIYGNEPTKRDLDVLNAIFHKNIDKTQYPNIYAWKSNITRYPNEEMDFFPSPRTVKKSHSFVATASNKKDYFVQPQAQTPTTSTLKSYSFMSSNTSSLILNSTQQQSSLATAPAAPATAASSTHLSRGLIRESVLKLPMARSSFLSQGRTKSLTAISLINETNDATNANTTAAATATATAKAKEIATECTTPVTTIKLPLHQHLKTQRPLTPLNKLRGLFSAYRECPDNSPLSTSP